MPQARIYLFGAPGLLRDGDSAMYSFARTRWRDVAVLILLYIAISLFHLRGIAPGQTFLPVDLANNNFPWRAGPAQPLQNWLISDPLYQYYPFLSFNLNVLREFHSWPLWNPYILLGHPVIADPLAQPFYPPFMLLGLLFGPARGLALGLWLHACLAATLSYGFLRTIHCTRRAAALGALTYVLSGYFVTWFETPFWVGTMTWLPGVLWAFQLALQRRRLRYVALAALAYATAILAGQLQFVVTFTLFLGLYTIGRLIEGTKAQSERKSLIWPLLTLVLTVTLGGLSAAVALLPLAEFLPFTRRLLSEGLGDPLALRQLVTLLVPNFYGTPVNGAYWGQGNYSEDNIYAGIAALLLALLAPFADRRFSTRFLFLLALFMVYFVVGGPGARLLTSLPILKYTSLHRSAFIIPLILAWLAARAMSQSTALSRPALVGGLFFIGSLGLAIFFNADLVREHWMQLHQPLLHAAVILFGVLFLLITRDYLPRYRGQIEWMLVALVWLDLFAFGSRYNPAGPIAHLMPPTPAIEHLQATIGHQRVVAYQRNNEVLFGPNVLSIYSVAEAGGYSSFISRRLHELITIGDPQLEVWWMNRGSNMVPFSRPSSRLLDLLGVSHFVSAFPPEGDGVVAEVLAQECITDSGAIDASHPVSGAFSVRHSAINRLDLQFRVLDPGALHGTLLVRLWRGQERQQLIMESAQDASTLGDQQVVTVYFEPVPDAAGHTFVWEVSTSAAVTGTGLCADALGQAAVSVYGIEWTPVYQGEVGIFKRTAVPPRAYVVYAAESIADDKQTTTRLFDDTFDLHNVAITTSSLDLPDQPPLPSTPATITAYQPTYIAVDAVVEREGLLVLSDQFYPGWRVYVDEEPAVLHRVNYLLRGVRVPPGEHEITFRFMPSSLYSGIFLSLTALLSLGLLVLLDLYLGRRAEKQLRA